MGNEERAQVLTLALVPGCSVCSGRTEIYLWAQELVAVTSVSREDQRHRGVVPVRSSGSEKVGARFEIQTKGTEDHRLHSDSTNLSCFQRLAASMAHLNLKSF